MKAKALEVLAFLGMLSAAWLPHSALGRDPGSREKTPTQVFTIEEHYGVLHPDQIIDFDLAEKIDAANSCMVGPDGKETICQLLENGRKVAVRADLPPRGKKTWRLIEGRPPAANTPPVKVQQTRGCFEITSGPTGVRVPLVYDPAATKSDAIPAPIQGIRLRDGTWAATGPNRIKLSAGLRKMRVRFVEKGPLKVVVEVEYEVDRGERTVGRGQTTALDPAVCKTTITIEAGQPSILLEQETDVQASYALDLGSGLKLSQARYRGHHSSSKETGYEKDGRVYRASHERPAMDAFFDLPFDRDYASSYCTDLGQSPTIRRMAVWDPWIFDSGRYWQVYDKNEGGSPHLIGIFAGRASRALGASNSGAGFYTKCPKSGGPAVGIDVQMNLRSPDARVWPRVRFQWGLFVGSKGHELADPLQVQPIASQMNLHAGINLNKVHRLIVDFHDPPGGYGSPYMGRAVVERMIEKLRKDTGGQHGKGYHGYLAHADPSARDLIEMWADASGEKVGAVVKGIEEEARSLLDALVHEDGIYSFRYGYWHGGLEMSRKLLWIDQVLGSTAATPEMKARVKAAAVLFGAVLWDNDFVPMDDRHGLNLGTPNMPVQQAGFRNQYALFLAGHPMMQGRVEAAVKGTAEVLGHDINEFGAHLSCVHYVGAGMGPTLTMMQQLKTAGVKDFFRDEPRVAKFAEFYMNCTTPPEPRFGGRRKNISVGDGATEPSELFGQMATGFADVNPALGNRLAGLWQAQGKPHSSFHGTTLLKIDEDLPAGYPLGGPELASANFPGQFSVLRTGWNTPHETAVWFINGNHYYDHSHCDQGAVVLYALGAPMSIDWGPI